MIEIHWNPSRGELRFFAVGLALLAAIGGFWGQLFSAGPGWASGLWAVGVASLLTVAGWRPGALRPLYLAWMIAVFPIGWLVSHLVLAVVYFGLFGPIGWFLRFRGYDPLQGKPRQATDSYWLVRPPVASRERYFRQY